MTEEEKFLPEEASVQTEPAKPAWQAKKEGWYDKIPLTVKQLDIIIGVSIAALIVVFIVIGLDAAGIF